MKKNHPIWQTLISIKGNQRACVLLEPLWAIPYNLILPYASVYMAAIGLKDGNIGVVASLGMVAQFLSSLFSGAIVDKYGRRKTMLVFGLLSWTIPCLLWAGANGYWYFMLASIFNGMWRVCGNSFSCMVIEDGDKEQLVHIYTIVNFVGLLAGFISPLAGLCIDRFDLIPSMKVLYLTAMFFMSLKFAIQYKMTKEGRIGLVRKEECKEKSLFYLTFADWSTFIAAFRKSKLQYYIILMTLMTCFNIVQAAFWPLVVTTSFGVSSSLLSVFPLVKTIVTMLVYLFVISHINIHTFWRPFLLGVGAHFVGLSQLLLCLIFKEIAMGGVFISVICEAFGLAILGPLSESVMSAAIPDKQRARVNSFVTSMILLISIPAGWIAGLLSQHNRILPLIMNLCLLLGEAIMLLLITKREKKDKIKLQTCTNL